MTAPELAWTPTPAQHDLIYLAGSRFVEACPGSGKTRAIVARFERLAGIRQRRGVGLVSFTNAAVDEVVSRCGDAHILDPPNFVGTFDGFINRFLTGPYVAQRTGRYPRFIDSWASIPGAKFRLTSMPQGVFFELDQFDWDDNGHFRFDPQRAAGRYANALRSAYEAAPTSIDEEADSMRRRLVRDRQLVSSSASRRIALHLLTHDSSRPLWVSLLAARFAELIVDEAQDCGAEELAVLAAARDGGVDIVGVADLDQSIFEFRRADPAKVRALADSVGAGTPLDGNFRSSPAICTAGDALRVDGRRDIPLGPNKDLDIPVRLVEYADASDVAAAVAEMLEKYKFSTDDCVVLAHRRIDASVCAGAVIPPSGAGGAVVRFARAHLTTTRDTDTTRRRRAIDMAERTLLELAESHETALHSNESLAEELGLGSRWLRTATTRIIYGADPTFGRVAYTAEVQRIVKGLRWPRGVALPNLGSRLATPSQAKWSELSIDDPAKGLRWSTIHAAKGREYPAVVLVIPKQLVPDVHDKTCLDLIEAGEDGESRRVLYVGATRAQKLLVLAVHERHRDRVAAIIPGI